MEAHGPDPSESQHGLGIVEWVERLLVSTVLPAFVLTQWLTVRWQLPTRQLFNAAVLVGVVVVAVTRLDRLRAYRREVLLALVLVVSVVVSIPVNGVPLTVGLRGAIPYLGFVVLALASLTMASCPDDLRRAGAVATGTAGFMGLLAIIELAGGAPAYRLLGQDLEYPLWWERGRATGLIANPGRLGQVGALGIAIAPLASRFAVTGAILAGIAVGASGSRLSVLAAVSIGAFWFLNRGNRTTRLLWVGGLAAVASLVIVQLVVPAARDDLAARNQAAVSQVADDSGVVDVRVANLRASLGVWRDRPILGAGPGRFGSTTAWQTHSPLHEQYGLPDVRSPEFVEKLRAAGDTRPVDVGIAQLDIGWLQLLTELGLIGFLSTAALLASILLRAVRRRASVPAALVTVLAVVSLGSPGVVDLSLVATVMIWVGATLGSRT